MCVGAYQGNRYGITIESVPWAVVINHGDPIGSKALFAKSANAVVNRDKDYISTVLRTQKQMIKVVPIRPDQIVDFLTPMVHQEVYEQLQRSSKEKRKSSTHSYATGCEQPL
jgi:hypothetical protein